MTHRARLSGALVSVYLAGLAVVLMWPSTDHQNGVIAAVGRLVHGSGLSATVATTGRLEFVLNALIVVPVAVLGSLAFPRLGWRDWTALGFCGSVGVESIQGLLLPGRTASTVDVVANTAGALLGAALVATARWPDRWSVRGRRH